MADRTVSSSTVNLGAAQRAPSRRTLLWGGGRHMSKRWAVPIGKVKWYDAEKGFGFLSDDQGADVFVHADALPEGVATLQGGQGRQGPAWDRGPARDGRLRRCG